MEDMILSALSKGVLSTPLFRGDYILRNSTTSLLCLYPMHRNDDDVMQADYDRVKDWYGPPTLDMSNNPNNNSIVLKLTYKNINLLLTGDIEKEVEELLVRDSASYPLQSQILKVPHHGSRTSSTISFLQEVKPEVAVISVGERNRFGHPSQEVLQRYLNLGIKIYRTDRDGAVIVTTNGEEYQVKTSICYSRRIRSR
jgi:beta-lactamase superfamily II metal-dependent hydrolase